MTYSRRTRRGLRLQTSIAFAAAAISLGTGCSGSSSSSTGGATTPQLGQVSSQQGITAFPQSLTAEDGEGEVSPGFANMWDLDRDFTIASGGGGHFASALKMTVAATPYPKTQNYDNLTFMTPELGTADGVSIVVIYDGSISGFPVGSLDGYALSMAPSQKSRFSQSIDLLGATTPITLTFDANVVMAESNFSTEDAWTRVSIRDTANGLLETILLVNPTGAIGGSTANLDMYAGRIVKLFFESRMTPHSYALFDDVSIRDGDDVERVENGSFATGGITGWSRNTPSFVRSATTQVQVVEALEVTRSFYATPKSRWGRMVDTFTNTTGAPINETITYEVDLNRSGNGIIYDTPSAVGEAITVWDTTMGGRRDVGWLFGGAAAVNYTSDDTLGASGNGNDIVTVEFDISVPAGGSVALVNFLVMDTYNTGNVAADVNATADVVDTEIQGIVDGWPTDGITVNEFNSGMTQAQIDAIVNF